MNQVVSWTPVGAARPKAWLSVSNAFCELEITRLLNSDDAK